MIGSPYVPPARSLDWTTYGVRDAILFAAGFAVAVILLVPLA